MIGIAWPDQKVEIWKRLRKRKIGFRLRCVSFFFVFKSFCARFGNKLWSVKPFCAQHIISYLCVMHACIICIAIRKVKYFFPNLFHMNRDMGDRLEARLSAIENIQEEFGHDIREVKEHLARLTSLFEDYIKTQAVHPRWPSPNQQVSRSFIRTTSHLPRGTDRPNLRQLVPLMSSALKQLLDMSIC